MRYLDCINLKILLFNEKNHLSFNLLNLLNELLFIVYQCLTHDDKL